MNYYEQIKQELINNEVYKKVKDYSKNKSDLKTYYNVGKILTEAGKHYGQGIIKEYSRDLMKEIGKGYNVRNLYNMKLFYLKMSNNEKLHTLCAKLSWSYIRTLINYDENKILYYLELSFKNNLSVRELILKIKSDEYERLDDKTKFKLKNNNELIIGDLVKNPIILNNIYNKEIIKEKALKELILEDIDNFLEQLGNGFSYIKSEYKIKVDNRYNYIDLLLYNRKYRCYVVIELKVTELKKEHIGQIMTYMNYIDKNIKDDYEDKTIGIIITRKDNQYVMEYCSDPRIFNTTYQLI